MKLGVVVDALGRSISLEIFMPFTVDRSGCLRAHCCMDGSASLCPSL
eukprot:COSAG05_NODE_3372_length_2106_cov_2.549078_3_plen_47_part_00